MVCRLTLILSGLFSAKSLSSPTFLPSILTSFSQIPNSELFTDIHQDISRVTSTPAGQFRRRHPITRSFGRSESSNLTLSLSEETTIGKPTRNGVRDVQLRALSI